MSTVLDEPTRLLWALRAAGCSCFIDAEDGQFYCSPPARPVAWDGDAEAAIAQWHAELRALVLRERGTVH